MIRTFFTDRDLGRRFPEALREHGLMVVRHDELFPPACTDEEWLAHVGRHSWIALTHDQRIRYKPNERDAVLRNRVGLLVVVGKAPLPELAVSFLATLPAIQRFLEDNSPPFIAKVHRSASGAGAGSISKWYP